MNRFNGLLLLKIIEAVEYEGVASPAPTEKPLKRFG
jgi:hypothetical protein